MQVPSPTTLQGPLKFAGVAVADRFARHMPWGTDFPPSFLLTQDGLCSPDTWSSHSLERWPRQGLQSLRTHASCDCVLGKCCVSSQVLCLMAGGRSHSWRGKSSVSVQHAYSPILLPRGWCFWCSVWPRLPAVFEATERISILWWRQWE